MIFDRKPRLNGWIKTDPGSWVYVLYAPLTGLIKIGKSDRPDKRRAGIENQSGMRVHLVLQLKCPTLDAAFGVEKYLHELFQDYRSEFGEWFRLEGLVSEWVEDSIYGIHCIPRDYGVKQVVVIYDSLVPE